MLAAGAEPLVAAPCTGGMAGELPCNAIDLLSHVKFADLNARPAAANDVWGFVDLNTGREYVIAGYDIGTAVIDVTDPQDPFEVGFVDGQQTVWRDPKVYQQYDAAAGRWHAWAYVTADATAKGISVIDLGGLPNGLHETAFASDFSQAHNAYVTNTDYSSGIALMDTAPLLVVAGANAGGGAFRVYSLAEPAAPVFVGAGLPADYTHDVSS
ncbi:MAG TPA: choice-of-anchor B family protein, partial [Woeseiaceae bacterium]|nr:choice-of-anchor B family protein [Woeseiaceae bacterium]